MKSIRIFFLFAAAACAQTMSFPQLSEFTACDARLVEFSKAMLKGRTLHDNGFFDDAVKTYHEAEKIFPLNDSTAAYFSNLYYEMGFSFWGAKNGDSTQFYMEKSIELDPSPRAFTVLGEVFEKRNEPDSSIAIYDRGISLFPKEGTLYYNKMITLDYFGNQAEAYAVGKRGTDLVRNHKKLFAMTAFYAYDEGDWIEFFADGIYAMTFKNFDILEKNVLKKFVSWVLRFSIKPLKTFSNEKNVPVYSPNVHEFWNNLSFCDYLKGGVKNQGDPEDQQYNLFVDLGKSAMKRAVQMPYDFALKPLFKDLVNRNLDEAFLRMAFRHDFPGLFKSWKFYHKREMADLVKTLDAFGTFERAE